MFFSNMAANYRRFSRGQQMVAKALNRLRDGSEKVSKSFTNVLAHTEKIERIENCTPTILKTPLRGEHTDVTHLKIQGTKILELESPREQSPDLRCHESPNDVFDINTTSGQVNLPNTSTQCPTENQSVNENPSFDLDEFEDLDDDRDVDWLPPVNHRESDSEFEDNEVVVNDVDHEEAVHLNNVDKPNVRKRKLGFSQKLKQKQLRMQGKGYKGLKKNEDGKYLFCADRKERILTPRGCRKCCEKTSKSCPSFDEEDRKTIFLSFWEANWDQKKAVVTSLVDRKWPTTQHNSRRKCSFIYHLKKNDVRLRVCKNMFLTTLGIGEQTVYGWLSSSSNGIPSPHHREQSANAVSEKQKGIENFLDTLPKVPSHYCRATTSKTYLEPTFASLAELYRVYNEYVNTESKPLASMKVFQSVLDRQNISLYKPKKDQCDLCCMHEMGNLSETEYNEHIHRKDTARNEKTLDKERAINDQTVKVITMDRQSLLLSPKLQASSLYYKTKLSCHNFTIYDLATKNVACYFWHEAEGDLTANSFTSCIADYIKNLPDDIIEVVIFSHGCTYQNRNSTLSNALLMLAFQKKITIIQKILERGHTQMECDSVHSVIERKLHNKPIYCTQNHVDIFKNARLDQPYQVKYVAHEFFKEYSALQYYQSIRPGVRVGEPVVTDIRCLICLPSGEIRYKIAFEDEFHELPRRSRIKAPTLDDDVPRLHNTCLPIKAVKYKHLQDLKTVIPRDYHPFYDALPHL